MRSVLDPRDASPESVAALDDWLGFQEAYCFRPEAGLRALARCGGPGPALRAAGVPRPPAGALSLARRRLAACGARAVPVGAEGFPEALHGLPDGPALLHVRGLGEALCAPAVAIVGARAASAYGLGLARVLAGCFARAGLVVVSGLARGIDAAAHVGALEAGGRTVAVLGCGPDRIYPAAHRGLAERIAAQGALVSEFPPGTPPRAPHFPLRNRIISGLARALVVVEARERSGSLATALHADAQHRDVFAVPGPLGAATSAGTNRLLRDGALVLLTADDVLQRLGLPPGSGRPRDGAAAAPGGRVARTLAAAPATRDELSRLLGEAPEALALELLELEMAGLIAEDRDGTLRVVTPAASL